MDRARPPVFAICIRLFNNNRRSHHLLQNLYLPKTEIDVIEWFGSDHRGRSVKRAIRQRANPNLPFLIAVTNRARMGDAFPREVEWFLEFSNKAANLNSLLQGLLGRACGYHKNSTVVMSDENARIVDDYKATSGGYIFLTSPHSTIVGPHRRGAPTSLVRVRRDMDDSVVKRFFDEIDRRVVAPHVNQNSAKLSVKRSKNGYRTGPILRIAEETRLFEHLEKKEVRERLFPTYPEFRVARAHEEVTHARDKNKKLKYFLDDNGDCRFTFREWTKSLTNHGGARSRGYGLRDARDQDKAGNTLEPQINMRKFNPATGEPIDDKRTGGDWTDGPDRAVGHWRAEIITLPLVGPVRELQAGKATYPIERAWSSKLLNERERKLAGYSDDDQAA